jgi:AraC-like DNA-binding protein
MRDHFTEKPSLQSLARVAGYSLSYFKSKFREETGLTPAAYLSLLRLELAKDRLANTNCSVTQISEDLSFSSTSYFTAAFKKMTSFTPKEYREKYGTAQITSSRKDHPNQE